MIPKETQDLLKGPEYRKFLKKMTGRTWKQKLTQKGDHVDVKFTAAKEAGETIEPSVVISVSYNPSRDTYDVKEGFVNSEGKVEKSHEVKELDLGTITNPQDLLAGILQFIPTTKKIKPPKGDQKKLVKAAKKIAQESVAVEEGVRVLPPKGGFLTVEVPQKEWEQFASKLPKDLDISWSESANGKYRLGKLAAKNAKLVAANLKGYAKSAGLVTWSEGEESEDNIEEAVEWSDLKPGVLLVNNSSKSSVWWYKITGAPFKNGSYPALQVVLDAGSNKPSKAVQRKVSPEEFYQLQVTISKELPTAVRAKFGLAEWLEEAKALPIGTQRDRGGKTYVKTQQGWQYQAKAKGHTFKKGTKVPKGKKPLPKKAKAALNKGKKVSKKERLADLRKAQDLAFKGKHKAAKTLFAKHGIQYASKKKEAKKEAPKGDADTKTKNLSSAPKKDDDKTKVLSGQDDNKKKAADTVNLPAVPKHKSSKLEKLKGAIHKLQKIVKKYV